MKTNVGDKDSDPKLMASLGAVLDTQFKTYNGYIINQYIYKPYICELNKFLFKWFHFKNEKKVLQDFIKSSSGFRSVGTRGLQSSRRAEDW